MIDIKVFRIQDVFGSFTSEEFGAAFDTDEKCLKALSDAKWAQGFVCRACGHTHYCQGTQTYSRRCTRCKKTESATAHTIFHHCRISLPLAFEIAYRVCNQPSQPASAISQMLETRHMTCLNFKKKILSCLQSSV